MFFERFTEKARTAVVLAQQQARERGDDAIDTGHLLRALFAVPDNLAVMVLEGFSVRRADVEADLDRRRPGDATGRHVGRELARRAGHRPRRGPPPGRGGVRSGRAGSGPAAAWPAVGRPHPVRQGVQEGPGAGPARGHRPRAQLHRHRAHAAGDAARRRCRARRAGGAGGAAGRRAGDRRGAGAGPPGGVSGARPASIGAVRIDVVTIFPDYLAPLREALLGRALERGLSTSPCTTCAAGPTTCTRPSTTPPTAAAPAW